MRVNLFYLSREENRVDEKLGRKRVREKETGREIEIEKERMTE